MNTSRSVVTSLRGRVWLAAIGLAIVNALLGLAAYLALSFLSIDAVATLFATFLLTTVVTFAFGWWMSKDLLRPVEEVALLARSIERSPSSTIPRTTGAIETDELLQILHRNGQQIRNLIQVMDEVAAGRTEAATLPLESSDKLSAAFQKLVSKVTDSINAKKDLDDLQTAIGKLASDVAKVRGGQLDINLRTDQPQTKEIAEAVRFLTTRLTGVTQQIFATTLESARAASEAQSSLQAALGSIDRRSATASSQEIRQADNSASLLDQLSNACKNASDLYDRYLEENTATSKVAAAAERVQSGVVEANRLVQKLRSRTSGISHLARLAQDLNRRSSLIALNASLAAGSSSSPEVLAAEMEGLASRAEELHKQIILAGESLNGEIAGVEREVNALVDAAPDISRSLTAGASLSHSLCESILQIAEIQKALRDSMEGVTLENDRLRGVVEMLSDATETAELVRGSELNLQRLSTLLETLRDSVSDLRLSGATPVRPPVRSVNAQPLESPVVTTEPADAIALDSGSFEMLVKSSSATADRDDPTAASGFETMIDVTAQLAEN